jgi:hypothetical protein
MFQSMIWSDDQADSGCHWQAMDSEGNLTQAARAYQPMYFIGLCAQSSELLPDPTDSLCAFGDTEQSVYQHYYHEIRKNMQAGQILAQRDDEIEQLRRQLQQMERGGLWNRWFGKYKKRS